MLEGITVTLDGEYEELVERFFDEEWTDGLPVVLPTEARVRAMLGDRDPELSYGAVPPVGRLATAGIVAVNAVMAGCRPEHFPIVEAVVRGMLRPEQNLNGVTCTTHMCVPLIIVNGPQRHRLRFNSTDGVFGNGNRSNGALGRALRLVCWNLGGARPGGQDRSTLSHPGEWTFCIAEDEEGSSWEPLHVQQGFAADDDVVSLFACEPPHSVIAPGSPEAMLERIMSQMTARGSNTSEYRYGLGGQMLITINSEQAERFIEDGWTKETIRRYLWERTTCKVRERLDGIDTRTAEINARDGFLARGEVWSDWSDPDADLTITPTPDDLIIVVTGGRGWFASVLPGWGPGGGFLVSEQVSNTRAVTSDDNSSTQSGSPSLEAMT
jgi:hypothetical protein